MHLQPRPFVALGVNGNNPPQEMRTQRDLSNPIFDRLPYFHEYSVEQRTMHLDFAARLVFKPTRLYWDIF